MWLVEMGHVICYLEAVSENTIGWNVSCDLTSWSSEWKIYDWLKRVMWLVWQDPEGREGDVWGGVPCVRGDRAGEGPPESTRGPQVGPERPDVPLPASEATDARPGEVRTTTHLGSYSPWRSYGHLYVMAAIFDAILNFSNCSRVTTCHRAVSENRYPWLPKSTAKKLNTTMQG